MSFRFPSFVSVSFSSQPPENEAAASLALSGGKTVASGQDSPSQLPAVEEGADERRIHQRFVARLHGEPCFWAIAGGERLALNDLSLKGFALPATPALAHGAEFEFTLHREGVPDAIQGHAEVTAVFGQEEPVAGCRIVRFEGDGETRLHDWLVTHVIRSATVRITEKDAAMIVSGRSLV